MARYDYKCTSCGTVFEVEHPMSERPQVSCPSCGAPAERQFCASSIVFSGSGFYNTDQRGGLAGSGEKSGEGGASGAGGAAKGSSAGGSAKGSGSKE